MNIAILGIKSLPATAGADRVVEKLLENFSDEHDYWIYIRKDTPGARTCERNLHFIHVTALKGKHLGAFSYFLMCCLHYLLKGRYDLTHVHNSDFGLFVPLLRLKPGVPVLGTFHGDPYARQKWGRFARWYLRVSERVFVTFSSRLTSVSRFKAKGRGLLRGRGIDYIPNGVDPYWEADSREEFDYARFGLEKKRYLLFACGRLDPTKGLHHLLDAYFRQTWEDKVLVVGDFSHDPVYSRRIDEAIEGREDVVVVRDLLPRDTLLDVLRNCRVFVFPSEVEAMSMMLLEAISCKAPVLCSDIPENLEVVGADYAYAYPVQDSDALLGRLTALLRDPHRDRSAEALYERCMSRFGWPTIAAAYESVYRAMTTRAPSASAPEHTP